MPRIQQILGLSPTKIAGGYLVFGGLWILLSDRLVTVVAESQSVLTLLQTIKGWAFVLFSAILILGLTHIREKQLESIQERAFTATQELQVLHRIFRHNIRNDLNVIHGYVDLVRSSITGAEDRARLDAASRTAKRIVETSDKLKVIDRVAFHPEIDEVIDLTTLLRDECDRIRSAYPGVVIETDLPAEVQIVGDHSIAYVVREVLENAMEHHDLSPEQRRLTISVEQTITETTVRVSDNGPGIPSGETAALRAGEETPLSHGSGVGLWLVTWLCRLVHGRARFETEDGDGSVVTLTFQRATPLEQLGDVTQRGDGDALEA